MCESVLSCKPSSFYATCCCLAGGGQIQAKGRFRNCVLAIRHLVRR